MTKGRAILAAAFAGLAAVALMAGLLLFWFSADGQAAPAASDTVTAGPGNSHPADSFETAPSDGSDSAGASGQTGAGTADSAASGAAGTQTADPWVRTGWVSTSTDGSSTTAAYYYDEAGRPTRQDHLNSEGELLGYWLYEKTQSSGRQAWKIQYYTAKDEAESTWTLDILDEAGRLVRSENYDASGALLSYTVYQYDAQGREIAADSYSADQTLESKVDAYEYDSYGNVTARHYNNEGTDGNTTRVTYTYERLSAALARQQAEGIAY